MLADTAQLAVNLTLGGNFTSGITQAESSLGRFAGTAASSTGKAGVLSSAFGTIERAAGSVGGALNHAGNQLKGLLTGPLGFIGLGAGLLSFGGAVKDTIGKLDELAFGTEKLTAITGASAESTSTLIFALQKYGIDLDRVTMLAGFYEKTVGKLADTTSGKGKDAISKLDALQKQFGVTLVDSSGKAVDFNTALLNTADAYSKMTDESQKAYLASQIFGRGYAVLAPVLALGRQGILDLQQQAAQMGLQLSDQNVAEFAKYREAVRGSQEAIAGLEVAIGEQLLPTITDLANGLSSFVSQHKGDITNFFKDAIAFGRQAAGVVSGFASTIIGFWNGIPKQLRDLMVGGFVANKTISWLFGISPIHVVFDGIEKAIANALGAGLGSKVGQAIGGSFLSRGSTPVNPLFVHEVAGGLTGAGGLPETLTKAGIGSIVMDVAATVATGAALGLIMAAAGEWIIHNVPAAGNKTPTPRPSGLQPFGPSSTALPAGVSLSDYGKVIDPRTGLPVGSAPPGSAGSREDRVNTNQPVRPFDFAPALYADAAAVRGNTAALSASNKAIADLNHREKEVADYIGRIKPKDPEKAFVTALFNDANRIASSTESTKQKLADLTRITDQLASHGDRTAQSYIQRLITAVKSQKIQVSLNQSLSVVLQNAAAGATVRRAVLTSPGKMAGLLG